MSQPFPLHIRTITGLEGVLAEELTSLGALEVVPHNRMVTCKGDKALLYKANIFCRTAIRVLLPFASFSATEEKLFYEGLKKIDWGTYLSPEQTIAIDVNVYSSFATHSLFLAQLAKDAIVDQFRDRTGKRPSVDLENPDIRIAINLFQNTVQMFLDSSGQSLHKRGYRKKTGDAPLSETLAAGILKLSGWNGTTPLLDPMCGSGTFCIEAGLLAKNIAPGLIRKDFGFQRWPDYDADLFNQLIKEAQSAVLFDKPVSIFGFDLDPEVVEAARENLDRAGLRGAVQIEKGDFFSSQNIPTTPGTLVMNPPYDERLPLEDVASFYQGIGDRFKHAYGGWKAYVLAGNLEAAKFIGLKSSRKIPVFNGPIECRVMEFEIRAAARETTSPGWRNRAPENPQWKERAEVFGNRLRKNFKHLGKKAKREGTSTWRVYDWDIPELAFYLDIEGDHLHFHEVERNHDRNLVEHKQYIDLLVRTAAEVLNIDPKNVSLKKQSR